MDSSDIITQQSYSSQLNNFEAGLLGFLTEQGLPTDSVLVSVNERVIVFRNLTDVLSKINDQLEAKRALEFLEIVSGKSYIPEALLSAEIDTAVDNLLNAHRGWDNFNNEPPFAKALETLINHRGQVPLQIREKYILGLVEVFITNGNGISRNAETSYKSLIERFDTTQAVMVILSFHNTMIASKLQHNLCQSKYRELLNMMKLKVSAPVVKELIDEIEKYKGPLDRLREQSDFKKKVDNMRKIIF